MKTNKEKLDAWLQKNKIFAIALPLVLIGGGYFVVSSFTKFKNKKEPTIVSDGYNNSLPFEKKEINVKDSL